MNETLTQDQKKNKYCKTIVLANVYNQRQFLKRRYPFFAMLSVWNYERNKERIGLIHEDVLKIICSYTKLYTYTRIYGI